MQVLHENGIVSEAIDPHNILLANDQSLIGSKLQCHFYLLVKQNSKMSKDKPSHMQNHAPEVLEGQKETFKSDLWSVGIVLQELQAGAHPFRSFNSDRVTLHR